MSIIVIVTKVMAAVASATRPGSARAIKLVLAASRPVAPVAARWFVDSTIWMPWLMPMENIRNGMSREIGSIPIPISTRKAACQITAASEQATGSRVSGQLWLMR